MTRIASASGLLALALGAGGAAYGQEPCELQVQQQLDRIQQSGLDLATRGQLELELEEARAAGGQLCESTVAEVGERLETLQTAQSEDGGSEQALEGSDVHVVETETVAQTGPNEQTEAEIRTVEPLGQGASAGGGAITEEQAPELVGRELTTSGGEDVGEISGVARSASDQQLYALVDVGGLLGIGERTIAVPLDGLQTDADGNVTTGMARDEIENQDEYDPTQYASVTEDEEERLLR